ncbi:MAG: glycosyltransferase family 4 protein [Candidatus Palauibacterales bacterium]|nr:glycosyltransferase family 4 protein [Candidatus Palauibacterales bacterium]
MCLVAERWWPTFSGAARRFEQYLPGLADRGVDVQVICPNQVAGVPPGGQHDDRGSDVVTIDLPAERSWRRNALFQSKIAEHVADRGADVVHFLTLEPLRTFSSRGLRGMGRKPARLFTGTLIPGTAGGYPARFKQRLWLRHAIGAMDHLVVSSDVMGEYYRSLGIGTPRTVIPNGVNLSRFRPVGSAADRRAARAGLGLPEDAEVLLFIGSIIRRKGVDLLVDSFLRLSAGRPNAHLLIVGPEGSSTDDRELRSEIDRMLITCAGADRVHFVGQVPMADPYYRAADLFVLPSRREGMGNVVLEAMATELPVVLTPYVGLPEELGDPGREYILCEHDADALASEIGALLDDPDRRLSLGTAARRWMEEHMDMEVVIDDYARLYQNLAVEGRPATVVPTGAGEPRAHAD